MGTNFYVKSRFRVNGDNMDPKIHIGKRSAAGPFCWDCGVTLCKAGPERIHYDNYTMWHEECPICGKMPKKETLLTSSAGRELGFNKTKPQRKTGVSSCCSFTWARPLGEVRKIVDEYGDVYSRKEFLELTGECPIHFYKYGVWFS